MKITVEMNTCNKYMCVCGYVFVLCLWMHVIFKELIYLELQTSLHELLLKSLW